jgi:hypothetical protein
MRYLELNYISKTNNLFKKLKEINPLLNIEVEAYSCKASKKQKNEARTEKPLRYLTSCLQLCFPDYDFCEESWESFRKKSVEDVQNEITYSITTTYKNSDDVREFVDFLTLVLDRSITLKGCDIYSYEARTGPFEEYSWYFCFLLFNKKRRRVIILTLSSRDPLG